MAKVKVSQSTINDIKKMGMAKALKLAALNAKADQGGVAAEWNEGVKRMYGARRFAEATKSNKVVAKSADAARKGAMGSSPAKYKSADAARSGVSTSAPKKTTPRSVVGGTAAQKAYGAARAGGNIDMNRTTTATPAKPTPRKPYVAPKPTAQQIAQGKARAGGNVNFNPKPKPKAAPETAAQKAAKEALKKKQRAAAAAAVKRAGRSM